MDDYEKEWRRGIYFGKEENSSAEVCILALIGSKKQFVIFPEARTVKPDTHRLSEGGSSSFLNGTADKSTSSVGMMDDFLSSFGFEDGDVDAGGDGEGGRSLVQRLAVWMERLEDGSLKRYSIDSWPQWHSQ